MTPERQVLLLIRGAIAELPGADRARVDAAVVETRLVLSKHGDAASLALALLGAEAAAEG